MLLILTIGKTSDTEVKSKIKIQFVTAIFEWKVKNCKSKTIYDDANFFNDSTKTSFAKSINKYCPVVDSKQVKRAIWHKG